MNYFELFPGDYQRDTKHLTIVEHGSYLLLLMAYYSTERPLPADPASLYRIAGAMTSAEQKAVQTVVAQFFPVGPDKLRHNARADDEIAKAQRRIGAARENGKRGGRPAKREQSGNPLGFDSVTHQEPEGKAPHTPYAIHKNSFADSTREGSSRGTPTEAGRACRLMREAGCSHTNPSHPALLAALAEGVTPETLGHAAREAVQLGKPKAFPWAIATARGRKAEGAQPIRGTNSEPHECRESLADRNARRVTAILERTRIGTQ